MKSAPTSPNVKHLVLVGGGHSHLAVIKHLGMHPVAGLAATLISRDIVTPYSGSLPGHITGHYNHDQIHIDLRPLAQFAGVRIIQANISNIDLQNKIIQVEGRPSISFDILSLNIGSQPDARLIPGAASHAIGVKPIDLFLTRWQQICNDAIAALSASTGDYTLAIVGGGPASVELAFAAQHKILEGLHVNPRLPGRLHIKIISADAELLAGHNQKVRRFIHAELAARHIDVVTDHRVSAISSNRISSENKADITADAIVYATGASIPDWPAQCGLAIGKDGFIEVNNFLQSTSHPFVFAAGDAATIKGAPRPKSGVFAVRQGPPLAENLVLFATGRKLKPYKPQRHALALINLADKTAIASRDQWFFKGRWVWSLKNWIDNAFVRKYAELPVVTPNVNIADGLLNAEDTEQLRNHALRCAGCGAKVAGNLLDDVLQELPVHQQPEVIIPESRVEDASRIRLDNNRVLLQSVDQVTAFIDDPFLFAKIATNHCLSDIYAMGSQAHSALAMVGLPFASKPIQKSQLRELMLGCSEALLENDCALIGGHSAETNQLSFGLCVNGFADEGQLLTKHGMRAGDILILTKPLGTGTLLAADMRCKARHRWIQAALTHMLQSNQQAAACLLKNQASACTDVTGFGLAGHLLEMLEVNCVEVEIELHLLPVIDGALECLQAGIVSSLHDDNKSNARTVFNIEAFQNDHYFDLLFDPQTSGGLLASVAPEQLADILQQLHAAGYSQASAIGRVSRVNAAAPALILK